MGNGEELLLTRDETCTANVYTHSLTHSLTSAQHAPRQRDEEDAGKRREEEEGKDGKTECLYNRLPSYPSAP